MGWARSVPQAYPSRPCCLLRLQICRLRCKQRTPHTNLDQLQACMHEVAGRSARDKEILDTEECCSHEGVISDELTLCLTQKWGDARVFCTILLVGTLLGILLRQWASAWMYT